MKANELMIGDWVQCTYWHNPHILQVYELKRAGDDELKIVVVEDMIPLVFQEVYIEPIPLTAEILEKNGFIRQQFGHFRYKNEDNDLAMVFYPKEKNYTEGGYDYIDIYKGRMILREMPISYVHELQHALRLCGIDKEIVL